MMKLDEAEQEVFRGIQQEFVEEFGEHILFAVYRMHRKLSNRFGFKSFPIREIRDNLLYNILESGRFDNAPLHQVFLELEKDIGIDERTFYSFYHNYYIPRKK